MATPRIRWWRVEVGFVGNPRMDSLGHFVVDLEDDAFDPVVAVVLLFVLPLHDGEGVQDVGDGVTRVREVALELGQFLWGLAVEECLAIELSRRSTPNQLKTFHANH